MQTFTGWEYLLIDAANHYGLDKELFEDRIQWAEENLDNLEQLADQHGHWKEKPLFQKTTMAIRDAQQGKPVGHAVGFDAVCSGMQIMSVITGCIAGADATGLIDPNRRADAYTDCNDLMGKILGYTLQNQREKVKPAVMTVLYGSRQEPKNLFGDGTPELESFHKAMWKMAPGACELLQYLLESWQPFALSHEWVLPDNYHAYVKVMDTVEKRIEIDELNHATFTYQYKENVGSEEGLSNVANVIHSIDAYLLRSLIRRCNYNPEMVKWASHHIQRILLERSMGVVASDDFWLPEVVKVLQERYHATGMPDIRILDYCCPLDLAMLSTEHLKGLAAIVNGMLQYQPFEVVAVHDEFKCLPNNMNWLRYQYKEIMAELAESTILDDVFTQLHGVPATYQKKGDIADKIRKSNYALS